MARTLETALESVLSQIDERFEVVLVDDGSSDNSVEIAEALMEKYKSLRLIALKRDSKRKLGFTRNKSIEEARGEYVLLHLDCDDVTSPYIIDFVEVFHQIEACFPKDLFLSGLPIQMAKRSFLIESGPYQNIMRGEDRLLWSYMAAKGSYVKLDHISFKNRLPQGFGEKLYRAVYYTFDHFRNDFRGGSSLLKFFYYESRKRKIGKRFPLGLKIIRLMVSIPAWIVAKFQGDLPPIEKMSSHEAFVAYKEEFGGSFEDIVKKFDAEPNWEKLSEQGRLVFA